MRRQCLKMNKQYTDVKYCIQNNLYVQHSHRNVLEYSGLCYESQNIYIFLASLPVNKICRENLVLILTTYHFQPFDKNNQK